LVSWKRNDLNVAYLRVGEQTVIV